MSAVSQRLERLSESATLAMARKSRELRAQGLDIISLSIGEPDFNTPDFIKDAAKQAIDDNWTKYPPVPGIPSLREAIVRKLQRDNGLTYDSEQVVVSTGAKQAIMNVVLSMVNPGEEVLLPVPYWVSYREMVRMADGIPVELPTSVASDFKVTADQLDAAITANTRLIIFSTPCNPSGSAYTQAELEALARVLEKHPQVYIICDEIYEHILFADRHQSLAQFASIFDRVITVNGVSKAFAMTGWRIGYIAAAPWIAKACIKIQGQFTSGASAVSQKAAEAALLADPAVTHAMCAQFQQRRDLVLNKLSEIPGVVCNVPQGAFYVFPDVSAYFGKSTGTTSIGNANDLCEYLLNEAHVALVPGEAFGAPNNLRISYAASEAQLTE
ncbi:MAG: pyridoxal phosphate-dependent aminotransferase, partial [Bacteroidota bacterium]